MAAEYSEADLSPRFPSNGTHKPDDAGYQRLAADAFRRWRLEVSGLVERPLQLTLADIRALPSRTQITRHDCVEGWSAIAKWTGPRLGLVMDLARPLSQARYVMFFCADPMDLSGSKYYESIDFEDAYHPQTILAHTWNDRALPVRYGAPLRLRVERQLGYKMAKYIMRVRVVQDFSDIEGGKGGYWEDRAMNGSRGFNLKTAVGRARGQSGA